MTSDEAIAAVQAEFRGGLADEFTDADYNRAVTKVQSETGWTFPVSGDFKEFWSVERIKRHMLWFLLGTKALKFKYKQISLHQPFEHLKDMLEVMDEDWKEAVLTNPEQFPAEVAADSWKMFGRYIGAGFEYDEVGNDKTYENDGEDIPTQPDWGET